MKHKIGTEAVVIKAGTHEFEIGQHVILVKVSYDSIMKFTNLDKSDCWYLSEDEVKFIESEESELNLADYLPFPKEGLLVTLKNGTNAKLYYDLSEINYVGQYPILGIHETGQTIQFSLSGGVSNQHYSSMDIASNECTKFPEDMWSVVSTDFNYLCIDEDGESWFFEQLPWAEVDEGFWAITGGKWEQNSIIPVSTSNWKTSLIKRPN